MSDDAILALADGAVFRGESCGFNGCAVGEAVFNTAMTGYQEILTDPSYHRQIVALTAPHIGNTGINPHDDESPRIFAAGLVVKEMARRHSNWRAKMSLPEFLRAQKTPAISDIDTRKLTRILRDKGALGACLTVGDDESSALKKAREFAGLKGAMLAAEASQKKSAEWNQGAWNPAKNNYEFHAAESAQNRPAQQKCPAQPPHIVVLDCGVKRNILRSLVKANCRVTTMPYAAGANAVLSAKPDGVVLSNGPGDPAPCEAAIETARRLIAHRLPILGICLGHQILALALGARTIKMKFGHHGANHPVRDLHSGRVLITSQNHGFAVDAESLPPNVRATHLSLFDGSLQGLETSDGRIFSFQGHPEASPGPHDAESFFGKFLAAIKSAANSDDSAAISNPSLICPL